MDRRFQQSMNSRKSIEREFREHELYSEKEQKFRQGFIALLEKRNMIAAHDFFMKTDPADRNVQGIDVNGIFKEWFADLLVSENYLSYLYWHIESDEEYSDDEQGDFQAQWKIPRMIADFNIPKQDIDKIIAENILKEKNKISHFVGWVIHNYEVPASAFASPESQQEAKSSLIRFLEHGDLYAVKTIISLLDQPEEFLQSAEVRVATEKGLLFFINNGQIENFTEMVSIFSISDDFIKSEAVQKAAESLLFNSLVYSYKDNACDPDQVIFVFHLSDNVVKTVVRRSLERFAESGNLESLERLNKIYNFPNETIEKMLIEHGIIYALENQKFNIVVGILSRYTFSDSIILSEAILQKAKECLSYFMECGYFNEFNIVVSKLQIPDVVVQETRQAGLIKMFARSDLRRIDRAIAAFNLSDEFIGSPEIQQAGKENLLESLSNGKAIVAKALQEKLKVKDDFFQTSEAQESGRQGIINLLNCNGSVERIEELITLLNISDDMLQSKDVQEACAKNLLVCLGNFAFDNIKKKMVIFKVSNVFFQSIEAQKIGKEDLRILLRTNEFAKMKDLLSIMNFPDEVIQSEEIQGTLKETREGKTVLSDALIDEWNNVAGVYQVFQILKISDQETQSYVRRALVNVDVWLRTKEIVSTFNPPDEILLSPDVQKSAEYYAIASFRSHKPEEFVEVCDVLKVPSNRVEEIKKSCLLIALNQYNIDGIKERITDFKISNNIIQSAEIQKKAKTFFASSIKEKRKMDFDFIGNVEKIISTFQLPRDVVLLSEVQQAGENLLINRLKGNESKEWKWFEEIILCLKLSDQIIQSPEIQEASKERAVDWVCNGRFHSARDLIISLNFSDNLIQEIKKEGLIKNLKKSDASLSSVEKIIKEFDFSPDDFQSLEIQEAGKERAVDWIRKGNCKSAKDLTIVLNFSDNLIQEIKKEGLIKNLKKSDASLSSVEKIIEEFGFSPDDLQSPDIKEAGKERAVDWIRKGNCKSAKGLTIVLNFSDNLIQEIKKEGLTQILISKGGASYFEALIEEFDSSPDDFQSLEIQEVGKERAIDWIRNGHCKSAKHLTIVLNFSDNLIQEIKKKGLIKILISEGVPSYFEALIEEFDFSPDDLQSPDIQEAVKLWLAYAVSVFKISDIGQAMRLLGASMDSSFVTPKLLDRLRNELTKKIHGIVEFDYLFNSLSDVMREKYNADPLIKSLHQILKLQSVNKNEENDPWRKEFQPLVNWGVSNKKLSLSDEADLANVVDYIKKCGMINLPTLFDVYITCQKSQNNSDLPEEMIKTIEEYGVKLKKNTDDGEKWRFDSPKQIFNELERKAKEFASQLLNDQIPANLLSKLGKEQFFRLINNTQWQRSHKIEDLVKNWSGTVEENPRLMKLPRGYSEKFFNVGLMSRKSEEEKPETDSEKMSPQEKIQAIISSTQVTEVVKPLVDSLNQAVALDKDPIHWLDSQKRLMQSLENKRTELAELLAMTAEEFDEMISQSPDDATKRNWEKKKRALTNENGRIGFEKQKEKVEVAIEEVEKITFEFRDEQDIINVMETLAKTSGVAPEAFAIMREVSAIHILRAVPDGWQNQIKEMFNGDATITVEKINFLTSFSIDYLKEHYLNLDKGENHSGHLPFSRDLFLAIERAWQLVGSDKKNIEIGKINQKIQAILDANKVVDKKNELTVSMVPCSGLLRIYSGDVGDACYTSKHVELAKGEFPGLRAWMYVTDRNKPTESLRGSVLTVSTKGDDGVPTIVVRANNPKENFIQSVDADTFVLNSLKEIIAVSRASIKSKYIKRRVAITLSGSGGSLSNRPLVADSCNKRFGKLDKVGLVNEPETNFNNYHIWNAKGGHPCVVIWEIDEKGKEIWHGNWGETEKKK